MHKVSSSIIIKATCEQVAETLRNPTNWSTFYVGMSDPTAIEGDGFEGTVVQFNYHIAGMAFPVTVEVDRTESRPGYFQWLSTNKGPLSGTQTFTYEEVEEGTRVTAELNYSIPGSVSGKVANRLLVEKMQQNSMEQTLQNAKMLVEEGKVR